MKLLATNNVTALQTTGVDVATTIEVGNVHVAMKLIHLKSYQRQVEIPAL